jgi:hypothetical protein
MFRTASWYVTNKINHQLLATKVKMDDVDIAIDNGKAGGVIPDDETSRASNDF